MSWTTRRSHSETFRNLVCGLLTLAAASVGARAQSVSPGDYLAGDYLIKPRFKPGNTLPKLTRFGWQIAPNNTDQAFKAYKALADDWGYALAIPDYYQGFAAALAVPGSLQRQLVDLARSNPDFYEVTLSVPRPIKPYEDGLENFLGTPLYNQLFLKDSAGQLIRGASGNPIWSPAATDAALSAATEHYTSDVRAVRDALSAGGSTARIGRLLNGGEYAMGVAGFDYYYWFGNPPAGYSGSVSGDPAVIASAQAYRDANFPTQDYLGRDNVFAWASAQRNRQEQIFTNAYLSATGVSPQNYHFYISAPSTDIGRYGGWWVWSYDYAKLKDQFPLPAAEAYPGSGNTGYTQAGVPGYLSTDILTKALTSLANQIHTGGPQYTYNYVSSGWTTDDGTPGNTALSMGFFKAYYTAGMLGAVENFYNYQDNGGFDAPIDVASGPPQWIRSVTNLPQVHAAFTWLDDFLLSSNLMPGPLISLYSNPAYYIYGSNSFGPENLPAYELAALSPVTQARDELVRVIAREGYGAFADNYLITVWASDGIDRDVLVSVPGLESFGAFTFRSRAAGSMYYLVVRDGAPVWVLLDELPQQPSLGLELRLAAIRGTPALVPEPSVAMPLLAGAVWAGVRRRRR